MRCAEMVMFVGLWLASAGALPAQVGFSFSFGTGVPVGGVWGPACPFAVPFGGIGPVYPGPIILPPLVIPAETMYGPQAVQRFFGIGGIRTGIPPIIITGNESHGVANDVADRQAAEKPKMRVSNDAARAQAAKFIEFGDANFQKQDFNAATERYRTAARLAPDLAEPYFRQALAQVACGRYERAAATMRRGLLIEGNPGRIQLRLDDLYAGNQVARTAHLEALALAVEQSPDSADLLLLLGMYLFFDDQADRAAPVFLRCNQLGGNEDGAITQLLPKPGRAIDPFGAGKET